MSLTPFLLSSERVHFRPCRLLHMTPVKQAAGVIYSTLHVTPLLLHPRPISPIFAKRYFLYPLYSQFSLIAFSSPIDHNIKD